MALDVHDHKSLMISKIKLMRFGLKSGSSGREAETCFHHVQGDSLIPARVFAVILNAAHANK
jgi:hypothetical protein